MKTWQIVVGSSLLGVVLGVGTTVARFELAPEPFDSLAPGDSAGGDRPLPGPRTGPQAKVAVDAEEFDFGEIDLGAEKSHAFVFTNVGDAPLDISKGNTTCKCTISKLDQTTIAPGESANVLLEWTAKSPSERFRESATIQTNDPDRREVHLTVVGRVVQSLEVHPIDLVFSKVPQGESRTARARVLAFGQDNLELISQKLVDPATAEYYEVKIEPIPRDQLHKPGAKSGLSVDVTVKAGMPPGAFRQRLELTVNVANNTTVPIPILGAVSSPISIFGPGWNSSEGVLLLGGVKSSQGVRHPLTIFIRGEDADQVTFQVAKVWPDALRIRLGEKNHVEGSKTVRLPIVIEVPPGAKAANHLGSTAGPMGEIVLDTSHPTAKQVRLLVQFAVEP